MPIALLDKKTAEQIAAGEVIENPASVVKELVENALDAGANQIDLDIEAGGSKRITVFDNGRGIEKDEIALAFKRFATSKLSKIDDLEKLQSLGFRGEALPSIITVAKVEMTTRTKGSLAGYRIAFEGGELTGETEAGAPYGTLVTVEDLFFNTPGRKKFLRSALAESSRISILMTEFALAYPQVAFCLKSNSRVTLQTSGDGILLHTIGSLYGNEAAKAMIELTDPSGDEKIKLSGYLSAPYYNRSSKRWITIIVNGRIIKNTMLINALLRGYSNLLPAKRYPLAILQISLESGAVDVNVHPSKTEIRFVDPDGIKSRLYHRVRQSLLHKSGNLPAWPDSILSKARESIDSYYHQNEIVPENNYYNDSVTGLLIFEQVDLKREETLPVQTDGEGVSQYQEHKVIGQFLNRYLVAQKDEDLLLIDQHAAHERLIYNQVKKVAGASQKSAASQLIIPYKVDFPPAWRELMPAILPLLEEYGIKLETLGNDSYAVRALPYIFNEQLKDFELNDLIERLISGNYEDPVYRREALCRTIACHRSVKAKQPLAQAEMEKLLHDWATTENAAYCPHGRPTVISFNLRQLEKSFLRRGT